VRARINCFSDIETEIYSFFATQFNARITLPDHPVAPLCTIFVSLKCKLLFLLLTMMLMLTDSHSIHYLVFMIARKKISAKVEVEAASFYRCSIIPSRGMRWHFDGMIPFYGILMA
jgi:hypothetical protein